MRFYLKHIGQLIGLDLKKHWENENIITCIITKHSPKNDNANSQPSWAWVPSLCKDELAKRPSTLK